MGWILSTVMVSAVVIHQSGGGTVSSSSSSASQSESRGGYASEADCEVAGRKWQEDILRRHPGATVKYTCTPER